MSLPRIAIICVTHGRPVMLRRCLESCVSQDYENKEILVVTNPVDPLSEAAVSSVAPTARIIRTHRNLGIFPAFNLGIANTDADYLMIVDDDAWFLVSNTLSQLYQALQNDPQLGAVTCNLEGPNETPITGGDRYIRVFTLGFTLISRKLLVDQVGFVPDLFFRDAGESYICDWLWELRRPVKRLENQRMHHALALKGRSMWAWRFYGIRSQVLCAVMREPGALLGPVLVSKFFRSLVQRAKTFEIGVWLHAWLSSLLNIPGAWKFRRPVSRSTRRLLRALDASPVFDLTQLPEWDEACSVDRKGL